MTMKAHPDISDTLKAEGTAAVRLRSDRAKKFNANDARKPLRFQPVPIDDVKPATDADYVIDGILPSRGLFCVLGPAKGGKSFLVSHMTFHIARGVPFAGRAVKQGTVFYVTGEGVRGFKRRLVAMRRHYGVEGHGVPFYMIEDMPDLGSPKGEVDVFIEALNQYIAANGCARPSVIVLDTLARAMGEGDENTARDMGRFVARCGLIERAFDCLVILVHHTGKDITRGNRGSSSLPGALDGLLSVQKLADRNTARVEEMKDGREGLEWSFRLIPYELESDVFQGFEPEVSGEGRNLAQPSTCVLELLSEPALRNLGATKGPAKPPRGVVGDLLKVIRRAIEDMGERNVDSVAVPNNTFAVSRENLKRYCETMDWQQDPDRKPNVFRAMLSKTLSALRSQERIGFDKEWVWLI